MSESGRKEAGEPSILLPSTGPSRDPVDADSDEELVIFPERPSDWQDLEKMVCQVFREMGCTASRDKWIATVRGPVKIDVIVHDKTRRPHTLIVCECKHWKRRVPKTVVHAFRTVVNDSGANLGFIISDSGFQAGCHEAATKANISLVTWQQFQQEMSERWFASMEVHLVRLADQIASLSDAGVDSGRCHTLVSEAIERGGEKVRGEFDRLRRQYAEFSLASTSVCGGVPLRRFPRQGIDPRVTSTGQGVVFESARMYFDIMFESAPDALAVFAGFILRHTDGRCGNQRIFDEGSVGRLALGKTTMEDASELVGNQNGISRMSDGESWIFRGSMTWFKVPVRAGAHGRTGTMRTLERTLRIDFGPDGVARDISIEDDEYFLAPRL